jgi:WS/DGAT/MGAT family acyltransferase
MHFGALAVLGPGLPTDPCGAPDLPEIRRRLARRLGRAPELRRALRRVPISCGRPVWVDDERFSIEHHVHVAAVSPAGGERELLDTAESLLRPLLDRALPLWELWLLTGLEGGRVGMLFKLHHSVADGLGALALLGSLFDEAPIVAERSEAAWVAAPSPSRYELFGDNVRGRLAALASLLHPERAARTLGSVVADATRVARAWAAAPRTSLNGSRTGSRSARVVRLGLETARRVGHAAGGKINDVVLSVVTGGLRDVLLARGETVAGVELKASVAVAMRTVAAARELGNAVGTIIVPLPVGESDVAKRLTSVARASREAKSDHPVHADALISSMGASGLARRMADRQRTINVLVTNLTGPRAPLYVLGAPIERILPLVGSTGNVRFVFAAASYCGELALVVNADGAVEDVDVLVAGMQRAWRELVDGALARGVQPESTGRGNGRCPPPPSHP